MNEAKDMAMEKRRTLIDAVDRLTAKANFAEEVAAQTFQLVDKFERTEGAIKEGIPTDGMGQKSARMPNIIDLFDMQIYRIEGALEKIAMNIEKSKNFID